MNSPETTPTRDQVKDAIVDIVMNTIEPIPVTLVLGQHLMARGMLRMDLHLREMVNELVQEGRVTVVEYTLASELRRTMVLPGNTVFYGQKVTP